MKSYSVYATKPFSWLVLATSIAAAGAGWYLGCRDPVVLAGILVVPSAIAALIIVLSRKAIIRVDRNGVAFHPNRLPTIPWADIARVGRPPRVEPTVHGLIRHPHDGCRPILLVLRDGEKYRRRLPNAQQAGLIVASEAGEWCYRIDFVGLPSASEKVHTAIAQALRYYQSASAQNGP